MFAFLIYAARKEFEAQFSAQSSVLVSDSVFCNRNTACAQMISTTKQKLIQSALSMIIFTAELTKIMAPSIRLNIKYICIWIIRPLITRRTGLAFRQGDDGKTYFDKATTIKHRKAMMKYYHTSGDLQAQLDNEWNWATNFGYQFDDVQHDF